MREVPRLAACAAVSSLAWLLGACDEGSLAQPGRVSGLQPDARFVTETEPLLLMAPEGILFSRTDGSERRLLVPASAFASYYYPRVLDHAPSWSAFLVESDGRPYLVRRDPMEVVALAPNASVHGARFSPDGSQAALVASWPQRDELLVVDVASDGSAGEPRRVELDAQGYAGLAGWPDEGHVLVRGDTGAGCWLTDSRSFARSPAPCPAVVGASEPPAEIACADGRRVSVAALSGQAIVRDAIVVREPAGERVAVRVEGWVQGRAGFAGSSAPSVTDLGVGASCRFGVFRYDETAYVFELATGRSARLSRASAMTRMTP